MRMIVCCCGRLGFLGLRTLYGMKGVRVVAVLTDKASEEIVCFSRQEGLPLFIGDPRKNGIARRVPKADLLVSVNYVFMLPPSIFRRSVKTAVNIHGSLLPRYMGRTPATWVIINDEAETGITVHEIVEACDSGPIMYQEKMPIGNKDTAGTLMERMAGRYPFILRKVVRDIALGRAVKIPQDIERRSYCGRRYPQDGLIDWRWSSRKVYNWVRAQTRPYPGAFFRHNGKLVKVWRAEEVFDRKVYEGHPLGVPFRKGGYAYVRCGLYAVRLIEIESVSRKTSQ
jgi:methionyl-tRNA formyltransferase